ncbi:MAG: hypothetical protein IJR48_09990, partial [Oscillibacter sp.]|nr:hypothetical protein [Oscillibacter sp.]
LAVNGDDLLSLGLSGRQIGRTLDALLNGVIEGELSNDRETLLEAARKRNGLPSGKRKRRPRRRRRPRKPPATTETEPATQ